MAGVRTWPAAEVQLRHVVGGVAAQVWPLLGLVVVQFTGAAIWLALSGDRSLLDVAAGFGRMVVVGLVGSFALHEATHVVLLRRMPGITHITLERTAWRFSVAPVGALSSRQVGLVAVGGPGACLLAAAAWWVALPASGLAWWYAAHVVFLLPVFGDGRMLLASVRAGLLGTGRRMTE
ncbi:hypothetical protein [Intrasporangium calvum]|uniref:DUF3267 domain-containing protein n=1 Tax=Intrasporangium calvum (strain ATCC 23552 / DSM 43043 / JCM 3097 / NBRC 12989 / NCIMB 10167 / NRRL B-3866 / 7 KIP) TaxID=710696 RepID=E6SDE6_INTC7|nr:hypothetical protein [Intrasporangium calvum]ADU47568.1 hypothetical protein Intca_1045 [Intrasporangium calvum DSM 43043]